MYVKKPQKYPHSGKNAQFWGKNGPKTATITGGSGKFSHIFFIEFSNPIKYTDPDGRWVINNVAVGAKSARDFASQEMTWSSGLSNYFGGNSSEDIIPFAYVFNPDFTSSVPQITSKISIVQPRIILDSKDFNNTLIRAGYIAHDNDPNTTASVTYTVDKMKNGNYEIKATVNITINGHSQLPQKGTVAFAGQSEITTNGEIDQNKIDSIGYDAVWYTFNSSPND
ncbi:hypothetical protein FACS1894130_04990 [Spirochaetia bacterium]|nr:hypothetical protein FACS1894130_04990 [Spirochaetia bacterium]